MRWQVEVTSMDKADAQSLVVEAESWQRALQAARTARGETGPISGFSIELLDEGYRAVDPMARLRFDVKRAADDAALTALGQSAPPPRPSERPASPSKRPPPPPPPSKAAKKPEDAPPIVPTPVLSFAPAPTNGSSAGADATIRTEALNLDSVRLDEPAAAAPPPAPVAAPALRVAAPMEHEMPVPATQVVFKRAHDPTERLPLTYREYVFTVARGVDEAAGERLLRSQLDLVRASIAGARPGKFVNLAVFDVVFQGRPPVPPLATLAWKDWRGDPQVSFPRRPASPQPAAAARPIAPAPIQAVPATMPTAFHPPSQPPPAAPSFPAPAPQVAAAEPVAPPPPPPPTAANPFAAPFQPAPADPFAPGHAPLPPGVPVPAFGAPPPPVAQAAPAPIPTHGVPLPFTQEYQPPPQAAPAAAPAAFPVPAHEAPPQAQPTPAPSATGTGPHRRPGSSQRLNAQPSRPSLKHAVSGRRATGDELIANLFEAMHELHFARDVIEGGDYVLALALEMIPSRTGIVHLYDIDRREYVVACVSGPGSEVLLNRRHPETEALLQSAMRKKRAIVLENATTDENALAAERYAAVGGVTSAVISPVQQAGRFLGVIELLNPLDGIGFKNEEGNAIDYISEQFGDFVATKGMQLDADRISRSVPPSQLT